MRHQHEAAVTPALLVWHLAHSRTRATSKYPDTSDNFAVASFAFRATPPEIKGGALLFRTVTDKDPQLAAAPSPHCTSPSPPLPSLPKACVCAHLGSTLPRNPPYLCSPPSSLHATLHASICLSDEATMRLVKFEIKPQSKCPVMRLLVLVISLISLIAPTRAAKPARVPSPPAAYTPLRTRTPLYTEKMGVRVTFTNDQATPFLLAQRGRARKLAMCADRGGGPPEKMEKVLILGAGWVGSRLATMLAKGGSEVAVTNRPGTVEKVKPLYFRPVTMPPEVKPRVLFEINDKATWSNLPPASDFDKVVITFPLASQACEEFFDEYLCNVPAVVCYSSTSVYQVDTPGQFVDETTKLKPTLRAKIENHFLKHGATVLTISGIFGEPRGPRGVCACLTAYSSAGGNLNARSSINMVHVDDILAATCRCLEQPHKAKGLRLNLAGENFKLSELVTHCKHPAIPDTGSADYNSKVVSSKRLLDELMPEGYSFVQPF
ncbi:hypothetical protein AB1Y20_022129 [Prymnesium parvum]|uniref:NAD-dependent epimerase/dehydratase domain-containing protein n=1 Tax=Prymnesium parvum TaxID=97485 RepID=A0AB34JHW8_PRYPA